MKKRLTALALSIMLMCSFLFSATLGVSAAGKELDGSDISFSLKCDKPGYEFKIYQIARLAEDSKNNTVEERVIANGPGEAFSSIFSTVKDGDTAALLNALDNMGTNKQYLKQITDSIFTSETGEKTYTLDGSYTTQGNVKTYNNYGIYYVEATNYPAGVKSVTNSVFSLPYYDKTNGWVYTLDEIDLASKVVDDTPTIKKEITNSTKNNVNFTDVSLGDTVNFKITASTAGSTEFKLKEYVITDDMNKGLTLDPLSFSVSLYNDNDELVRDITPQEYKITQTKNTEGEDSQFTFSMYENELNNNRFYTGSYITLSYSAKVNKYATTEFTGNPNTATSLKYTNKNNVSAEIEGNTVYVYTYKVEVNKTDATGAPLQGATFGIYKNENDAKNEENALATGTSDQAGKVILLNEQNEAISLQSGTYYLKELVAPDGYNRYTSVIPVEIKVEYGDTIADGTYITSAPENGTANVNVKNSKAILPQTGGTGTIIFYVLSGMSLVGATILFIRRKNVKSNTK